MATSIKVGGLLARVLETPGHTLDHISYVFDSEKALFAADTLFSIGCGRVFEGNYPMMWDSLLKLRALPDDFKLYCGHEYTASNVKFALTVEPDNAGAEGARRGSDAAARRQQADDPDPARRGEESQRVPARRRSVGRDQAAHEGRQAPPTCSANCANARTNPDGACVTAADIIARLELKPHPEGGHFRETFRDSRTDADGRSRSTAIYFLLARGERSHWHRIDAVEIWHYYAGSALTLKIADDDGHGSFRLGPISPPANSRRQSCRRMPGNPPRAPATGRWSAAPSRRDLILRRSSWRRRIGSRPNFVFRDAALGAARNHSRESGGFRGPVHT